MHGGAVDLEKEPIVEGLSNGLLPDPAGEVKSSEIRSLRRRISLCLFGDRVIMAFPKAADQLRAPARPQTNVVLNWFEELTERVPVP